MRCDQISFTGAVLHCAPGGRTVRHPRSRSLAASCGRCVVKREQVPASLTERGAPFTVDGFAKMLTRAAKVAGLASLRVHPHMLRHACGYKLANDGRDTRSLQAYLGHRNIQHTTRYTEMAPGRFKDFWTD